jgi:hypothetical protein
MKWRRTEKSLNGWCSIVFRINECTYQHKWVVGFLDLILDLHPINTLLFLLSEAQPYNALIPPTCKRGNGLHICTVTICTYICSSHTQAQQNVIFLHCVLNTKSIGKHCAQLWKLKFAKIIYNLQFASFAKTVKQMPFIVDFNKPFLGSIFVFTKYTYLILHIFNILFLSDKKL